MGLTSAGLVAASEEDGSVSFFATIVATRAERAIQYISKMSRVPYLRM